MNETFSESSADSYVWLNPRPRFSGQFNEGFSFCNGGQWDGHRRRRHDALNLGSYLVLAFTQFERFKKSHCGLCRADFYHGLDGSVHVSDRHPRLN